MKNLLTILFFSLLFHSAFAQIKHNAASVSFDTAAVPKDLSADCSSILIKVRDVESMLTPANVKILLQGQHPDYPYLSDEKGEVLIITDLENVALTVTPNPNQYNSIDLSEIILEKGKHYILRIFIAKKESLPREPPQVVKKPVIYLYPIVKTELELKLQINGELTFSYPAYKDGWKCTAMPNGDIKIGEKTYPYLFWEGEAKDIDPKIQKTGFVVKSENIVSFLEEKLSHIGLNDKETADFITFWAPQLEHNAYSFLHFSIGEEYRQNIAKLWTSVKPDSELHLHLFYAPVGSDFKVQSQDLPKFQRKGFTLVEWGGGPVQLIID